MLFWERSRAGKNFFRVILAVLILLLASRPGYGLAQTGAVDGSALKRAADYLYRLEKTRGVLTPWSYIALAAAGGNLAGTSVEKACQALFNELKNGATTSYATLILTILSAGGDPFNYQGQNLVQKLQEAQLPSGKFADNVINGGEELVNAHIWAMLALQAAGASIPDKEKALAWLAARQHADGGFHWYAGEKTTADVDSTGMALMALGALGEKEDSPSVSKALAYLQAVQNDNGGFSSWGVANPESCAVVIQGLISVGAQPTDPRWQRTEGNLVTALQKFQLADGSFAHVKGGGADEMATQQALLALSALNHGRTIYDLWGEKNKLKGRPEAGKAEERGRQVAQFVIDQKRYLVNLAGGQQAVDTDAAPFIEDGRTFVPIRYLAQALGISGEGIQWTEATQTVTLKKGATTLDLTVGKNIFYLNGAPQTIDVAPVVKEGRTYLPARYVAEAFGYAVSWDPAGRTVNILSN